MGLQLRRAKHGLARGPRRFRASSSSEASLLTNTTSLAVSAGPCEPSRSSSDSRISIPRRVSAANLAQAAVSGGYGAFGELSTFIVNYSCLVQYPRRLPSHAAQAMNLNERALLPRGTLERAVSANEHSAELRNSHGHNAVLSVISCMAQTAEHRGSLLCSRHAEQPGDQSMRGTARGISRRIPVAVRCQGTVAHNPECPVGGPLRSGCIRSRRGDPTPTRL